RRHETDKNRNLLASAPQQSQDAAESPEGFGSCKPGADLRRREHERRAGGAMTTRNLAILLIVIASVVLGREAASRTTTKASGVAALKVNIREWTVPTKGAHPHDPAVGSDGALWFTEQLVSKLGRLDPATGTFREYPLKGDNDGPHGLVADRDGNIWY